MRASLTGAPAPGAGRSYEINWPGRGDLTTSLSLDSGQRPRSSPTVPASPTFGQTSWGGAAAGSGWREKNGRVCYRIVTNGAGSIGVQFFSGYRLFPTIAKPGGSLAGADDAACYRFVAILSYDTVAAHATDVGLGATLAGDDFNAIVAGGTAAGWLFGPSGPGDLRIKIRGPSAGGLGFDANDSIPLPAGFDFAAWHAYEFRIVSATPTTDAELSFYLDTKRVASYKWGAGTVLPGLNRAGTHFGYQPRVVNRSAGVIPTTDLSLIRQIAAPTPAALL